MNSNFTPAPKKTPLHIPWEFEDIGEPDEEQLASEYLQTFDQGLYPAVHSAEGSNFYGDYDSTVRMW